MGVIVITILLAIALVSCIVFCGVRNSDFQKYKEDTNNYIGSLVELVNKREEELSNFKEIKDANICLTELNQSIQTKRTELNTISTHAAEILAQQEEKLARLKQLDGEINEKMVTNRKVETESTELIERIEELKGRLIDYQTRFAATVKVAEEGSMGWELIPSAKQNEFIRLVKTITDNEEYSKYTMLVKELRKAEWSVVWLPLMQKICLREGLDRSGIYRLVWKADESICYIGQAVNIKERWYTHIKKMLGVEAKGMERLYEDGFGPGDFRWEVIEFKDGNLDEDERYWMDWFKSREIGLNKRK